ncbi:hypothetical protein MNBD_IGNAVI01-409 [hydrothermal vent metagenome]|uniref:Uroporphyrinogen decarboxylase (URO-D) domain-containing protein n=1 Tax=hydrothermal vent metagenome TaxID=652676 RepID=A0A3B1C8R3_9ZZZZ
MQHDFNEYKKRHLAFWSLQDVKSPLIGFTIGAGLDSWSYWQYNSAAQKLFAQEKIQPEDINPNDFVEEQQSYLELSGQINDDICRSAMPLASIPWMEAILGCPIVSAGSHLSTEKILDDPESYSKIQINTDNPWVKKYLEFIQVYNNYFNGKYPVGQSVLRGPSDLVCALMGVENASIALLMQPEAMQRLLEYVSVQLEQFLKLQLSALPKFKGGYVIGQYEIWAPEPAIRIQEDSSMHYSPELYEKYLKSNDERIASVSNYTLIHLHSSSLILIDKFLEVSQIEAFQITKDQGIVKLEDMLPGLMKIQKAGKSLIIKGVFNDSDLQLIKKNISVAGLCLQPVVSNVMEAEQMLSRLRTLWDG